MKSRILTTISLLLVAFTSMAPGYGRPALEARLDNLVDRYEAALDPMRVYASISRQVSMNEDWGEVEERPNALVYKRGENVRAIQTEYSITWIREGNNSSFMAGFFPSGKLNKVFQGGTLFVRPDGIQINASLMVDGSLVWALTHPDGRVFKRTTRPDGTIEYSAN